ncbi:hypothetical protein ABZ354_03960 [Streptomyces sp. NPDC005925]|uniref:hypothetical protein n=1 Tax=Streptomyces sp. NPDC005925 TaxID=3157172 RepID=UPI0033F2FA9E
MTYTTGRESGTWVPEPTAENGRTSTTDTAAPTATPAGTGNRLLPRDECDRLARRMQQAVAGFVDGPRGAVKEADHVLEDLVACLTEAMTHRRRSLRSSWQPDGAAAGPDRAGGDTAGGDTAGGDTEQLRLALKDYRELAERLLRT